MGHHRWIFVLCLSLGVLPGCERLGCSGGPGYDATPLLESVRPSQREGLGDQVGVRSIAELPLYTIDVVLDAEHMAWSGTEELVVRNREEAPLEDVVLRLYPNARQLNVGASRNLTVSEVTVDGTPAEATELSPTAVRVPLPRPIGPGRAATLAMEVRGTLPRYPDDDVGGLGPGLQQLLRLLAGGEAQAGDYGIYGYAADTVNMGLWYPRLADRTEAGWDSADPAGVGDISTVDLANYRVSITAPAQAVLVTTGILESEETPAEGTARRTYVAAAVRSFAWQASGSYATTERLVGDVTVRSAYDRAHGERGARVLDFAAASLEVYERRFGPYPFTELDAAEAPLRGGAGGVEWPGLVTVSRMLYEPPSAPAIAGLGPGGSYGPTDELWAETLEFVVAHEVAHQYWNAVVGSDSRHHPYIDESLAQFSAAVYFEDRYGAERGRQAMERQVRLNYHLHRLIGGQDGAVDRPVDRFSNVLEYAGLVYGKGPYFFVALRDEIGAGAFWQGMQTYYERHAFRVAGPEDLPAIMAEVSANEPAVRTITRRWLHEAHGDEDLGRASLAQLLEPILGPEAAAMLRQVDGLLGGGAGGLGGMVEQLMRSLGSGGGGSAGGLGGMVEQLMQGLGGGMQPTPTPAPSQPPGPSAPPVPAP